MVIFKKAQEISSFLLKEKSNNKSIGFVPTMGALHAGHLSLIQQAEKDCDIIVCSIFVNPTQFNNAVDFEKYPSTIDSDIMGLEKAGCDVLFLPDYKEIYPDNFIKKVYELETLENILEGKYRPGHFQGVCMVVDRLLSIIPCNIMFLGKKDYQQCTVLQKMILNFHQDVSIKKCETIRAENGLAMSSRNQRLTEEEREKAGVLFKALSLLIQEGGNNSLDQLITDAISSIEKEGFEIDYLKVTDDNLNEINCLTKGNNYVALVAASLSNIRLIDNLEFSVQ